MTYTIEIGKSQIAKIIKNESNIQREYESFEGDMKKKIAKKKKIEKEDSKVRRHKRCVV